MKRCEDCLPDKDENYTSCDSTKCQLHKYRFYSCTLKEKEKINALKAKKLKIKERKRLQREKRALKCEKAKLKIVKL